MLDATPLLRRHARRRLAALAAAEPVRAQEAQLVALLRAARDTRFGRAHGFAAIDGVAAYQRRVPLRRYEAFWRDWWQPAWPALRDVTWPGRIPWFAYSSGTAGDTTKRIPVSREMVRANRRAALDTLVFHLANRPGSRVLGGRSLILGGSTALERLAPGVAGGDLSGIAAAEVPLWARSRTFPPRDLALIGDWDRKVTAMAHRSLCADVRSLSGTPSWMLLFFERLATLCPDRPKRLASFYPELELVVHGGVSFAPYRDQFARWLEGSRAEAREVYAASEGFVAAADAGPADGLRLMLDNGLFYEFVPLEHIDDAVPERHWLATAQTGVNYALVLTSNAGLWSYVLGDTVELVARDPPRVLVTGRISYTLSVAGEHLIGREIDEAVEAAARGSGVTVTDYAAGPVPPCAGEPRAGHVYVVEFAGGTPPEPGWFARLLDRELARRNADYAAHRQDDFGMRPPELRIVPPGTFAAWMRRRGKLGGQNKVPRVINDPRLLDDLLRFVAGPP